MYSWFCFFIATTSVYRHVSNVMAHAQKPEFVLQRNGRVHLIGGGRSVQSTTGSRGVRISGSNASNAGYIMFWGKVQDYWLPTPLACFLFTSLPVRHRVPSGFNWALPVLLAALYYVVCWRRQHGTGPLYVYRTEISHIQGSAITQNYRRK